MPEPEVDLSDLLPKVPFEELMMRSALGLPGQPPIEVGLRRPRFGEAGGRPWSNRQMALRRALGGVLYPLSAAQLVTDTERWLRSYPSVWHELQSLPEGSYGSEVEVLTALDRGLGFEAQSDYSTDSGVPGGSVAKE